MNKENTLVKKLCPIENPNSNLSWAKADLKTPIPVVDLLDNMIGVATVDKFNHDTGDIEGSIQFWQTGCQHYVWYSAEVEVEIEGDYILSLSAICYDEPNSVVSNSRFMS